MSERAARAGCLGNTGDAFEAAIAAGADIIETDCHATKDGAIVLTHDATLRAVTGERSRIRDLTRHELNARFRDRGGLLTLDEALAAYPEVRFNVDVKSADAAAEAGRILGRHADRVLLTSFSERTRRAALDSARRHSDATALLPATSPGQRGVLRLLAALAVRSDRRIRAALAPYDALQLPERQGPIRVVTRRLIDAAHRADVEVHVWTVNDGDDMRRLLELGVDGIVTDRTDIAVAVRASDDSVSDDPASDEAGRDDIEKRW